jgi:hypothetical protein
MALDGTVLAPFLQNPFPRTFGLLPGYRPTNGNFVIPVNVRFRPIGRCTAGQMPKVGIHSGFDRKVAIARGVV